jgi:hypothetical protein
MSPEHTIAAIIVGIVVAVGAFALAPKPAWLDRIWLWAIGLSFVLYVPLWFIFQIQDHGWKAVATGVVGLFVAGFIRGLPSRPQE